MKFAIILILLVCRATFAADEFASITEHGFNDLNKNTVDGLANFYDQDAHFKDPFVDEKGLTQIKKYYAHVYETVSSVHFDFQSITREGARQTAVWRMFATSPSMNDGKEMSLDGVSIIDFDLNTKKVLSHRDYYDAGEFIYERIPVLGSIIRFIKSKLQVN